VKDYEGRGKLR